MRRKWVPWELHELALILVLLMLAGRAYSFWGRSLLTENEMSFFYIGGLLQGLLLISLVFYLVRVRHRSQLEMVGLSSGGISVGRILLEGLVGGVLLMLAVALLALVIMALFKLPNQPQPFAEAISQAHSWRQLLVLMSIGSLLAPISEELYFRGLLYNYLRQHMGESAGIWLSGAVFAGMHLDAVRFIPLLCGGAGLAYIYQRTGSLYASILAHAVWNSAMTLFIWWFGGEAGI